MDRDGLADFLRRRRAGLNPADVGLAPGVRRRAEGLRREEVALLAGMSADYYTRLEQRRGPHPSTAVLAALARALRLTDDERDHLFHLSGQTPPLRHTVSQHVGPGVLYLLDHLTDTPAFVCSDLAEVLVENAMARLVFGDHHLGGSGTWSFFTDPEHRDRFPAEDLPRHARTHVADLRATHARRGGDPDVTGLVERLLAASPEFAALWAEHEVAVRRADSKRILHPAVGLLDLLCEKLTTSGEAMLVVLHPRPGTDCREKLDLLRVLGSQQLAPAGS